MPRCEVRWVPAFAGMTSRALPGRRGGLLPLIADRRNRILLRLYRDRSARRGGSAARAISGACHVRYTAAVVCSDGTWVAPSVLHGQAAGAWKEGEMARDPGVPLQPFLRGASAMAPSQGPPRGTWPTVTDGV